MLCESHSVIRAEVEPEEPRLFPRRCPLEAVRIEHVQGEYQQWQAAGFRGARGGCGEDKRPENRLLRRHLDENEHLSGFIFKARSPSCALEKLEIRDATGNQPSFGAGLFAREFVRHFPLLPVEHEGRLRDPAILEKFIGGIFGRGFPELDIRSC